ncbi:PA14 domain-containing protein, partial [Planctomycetota bacterium]
MDPSCVCAVVGSAAAFNPDPPDKATIDESRPVFTWSSGAGMISQKVFFSENLADVESMADSALVDETALTVVIAWVPNTAYPDDLSSGTYYWRVVTIKDDQTEVSGQVWSFSTLPAGSGGLQAEYFSNVTDLTGTPLVTRVDPQIDFNWNQDVPAPTVNREMFSVRWIGEIEIPLSDTYVFTTRSNDSSRIYVDDQLIINDWGTHAARDTSGTLYLEAGAYPIVVEYMQDGANANIVVSWESSLISKQAIPSVVLSPVVRAGLVLPAKGAVDVSQ